MSPSPWDAPSVNTATTWPRLAVADSRAGVDEAAEMPVRRAAPSAASPRAVDRLRISVQRITTVPCAARKRLMRTTDGRKTSDSASTRRAVLPSTRRLRHPIGPPTALELRRSRRDGGDDVSTEGLRESVGFLDR